MSLILLFRHRVTTRRRASSGHAVYYQQIERIAKKGKNKVATIAQSKAIERIKKALSRLEKQNVRAPHLNKYVAYLEQILSRPKESPKASEASPSLLDTQIDPIITCTINAISSEINRGILLVIIADE